jgi:Fusaric acid resistance protein-like
MHLASGLTRTGLSTLVGRPAIRLDRGQELDLTDDRSHFSERAACLALRVGAWFERVDPGSHRRIKGLRLVTAFGMAAMLATTPEIAGHGSRLIALAAGFALWASVSEARSTRFESTRDLLLLNLSAGLGAASFALLSLRLGPWSEVTLVSGSFCVGYMRRFGVLGAGIGSQIFIGQLLAYSVGITAADFGMIGLAVMLAALASVVPRILSGPAEQPPPVSAPRAEDISGTGPALPEIIMGLQAALASSAIIALGRFAGLTESAWAITACTYVVTNSKAGTIDRIRRRIVGTLIGVPLGLACLPMVTRFPLLIWTAAAVAMVIYAMSLPEHYEIACGAYAFALVVTMAESGEYPVPVLAARIWETGIGGALGIAVVLLLDPSLFQRINLKYRHGLWR